jgi:hypothetical protein
MEKGIGGGGGVLQEALLAMSDMELSQMGHVMWLVCLCSHLNVLTKSPSSTIAGPLIQ